MLIMVAMQGEEEEGGGSDSQFEQRPVGIAITRLGLTLLR